MPLKNYRAGRPCAASPSRDDLCGADCLIASPKRHTAIRHLAAAVKGRQASLTGMQTNTILVAMNIDTFVSYFVARLDY
jgi:hypothetical protein